MHEGRICPQFDLVRDNPFCAVYLPILHVILQTYKIRILTCSDNRMWNRPWQMSRVRSFHKRCRRNNDWQG